MRTKKEILKRADVSSAPMLEELELEVLIDIRDILAKISTSTVNLNIDPVPLSLMEILKGTKKEKQDV